MLHRVLNGHILKEEEGAEQTSRIVLNSTPDSGSPMHGRMEKHR